MTLTQIYRRVIESYEENARRKKSDTATSAVGRKIYRPISFIPTVLFIKLGFTANKVSIFSIFVLMVSGYFLAQGQTDSMFIGALIYLAFVILDFIDGNIARYSRNATVFGKLLDGFVDSLGPLIFIPIALGSAFSPYYLFNPLIESFLGVAIAICFLLNIHFRLRLIYLVNDSGTKDPAKEQGASSTSSVSGVAHWARELRKESIMLTPILLMLAICFHKISYLLVYYALIHCGMGVLEIILYMRKYFHILNIPTAWARELWAGQKSNQST
jgi:phosphatidylglycerophosphate synthase